MKKKILITGGAGFIGGNFVQYMVNKYPEYMIVNLDALTYAGNLETLKPIENKPNYKFVKMDICDNIGEFADEILKYPETTKEFVLEKKMYEMEY